jgi:hypothetical protein
MKGYWMLFRKDFRSMAGYLAILIASACSYMVFTLQRDVIFTNNFDYRMLSFILVEPMQFIFLPAVLFGIAFNLEWNSGARYQLLALPVRRWSLLLGKLTIVLVTFFLLMCLAALFIRLFSTKPFAVLFAFSFTALGVLAAVFAQGFSILFRGYRFTAWLFSFLAVLYGAYVFAFTHGALYLSSLWIIGITVFAAGLVLFTRFGEV